jgi:hypothetical protein
MKFIRKNSLGEKEYYIKSLKRYGTKSDLALDASKIKTNIENCLRKHLGRYDK